MNDEREVVITDAEWRAVMEAAGVFRDTAQNLRATGVDGIAAESDRHADALEGLGRRAVVAAAPQVEPDLRVVGGADLEVER